MGRRKRTGYNDIMLLRNMVYGGCALIVLGCLVLAVVVLW